MAYTTIKKPSDYFNTKLYTGNESTNAITGVGFQPDFVWMKNRDSAYYHGLYDSVRGTGNTKSLYSNAAEAEGQNSGNMNLASFNSDGFTLGATSSTNIINKSSQNHVSWNWKANGAGSANTAGSISSTVSANTTSGFSIVSYTGTGSNATVGHGLGSLCKWIIIKRLNGTNNWEIGNTAMGWGKHIYFTTTAQMTNSNRFQDTAPTNSVFYIGDGEGVNASGGNYIAYCFAEKQGFSKFGSYVGNSGNNADAPFIYTGFKPAFFLVKNTAQASAWEMYDSKRLGYNDKNYQLRANENAAEGATSDYVDFLSNGLKIRHQGGGINETGDTFIYTAFAEEPLVGDNPATAR